MPKIDLVQLYAHMQQEMLQKLQTGSAAFVHSGTKGDNTETNWIEWFRSYLPKRYNVDKGIVIDSTGKQSQQIDIIIYDSQYSYLVFRQGDGILIPAESVYAVLEVKQDLNKTHIEYAIEKAKSVRELMRTSAPIKHAGGEYPPKVLHEIVAGILTTRSAWAESIDTNVVQYVNDRQQNERLDFVCCISSNTFAVDNNVFVNEYSETDKSVIRFCGKDESLVFLLLNLLKRLQDIGTVPAIDFSKYAEKLNGSVYRM